MEHLRKLRRGHEFTQQQMADMLGVQRSTYTKYENGGILPNALVLQKLSEIFSVSVDYLLGNTNDQVQTQTPSNEKEPAAKSSGLDEELVNLLMSLSPEEAQRVRDFVAGLKASREGHSFRLPSDHE